MTREEAIDIIENKIQIDVRLCTKEEVEQYQEALTMALTALRPITREQVEKVWRGEWMALDECSNEGVYCKRCKKKVYRIEYANEKMRSPFCPSCGAPMTDKALDMVMERLEAEYE